MLKGHPERNKQLHEVISGFAIMLPEAIRLSISEATLHKDAQRLQQAHGDIQKSLEGPSDERVGREILVLCAESALKVREGNVACSALIGTQS